MTVPFKQSIDGQFTMSRVRASNPDGTFTHMSPEYKPSVPVAAGKESMDGMFQRSRKHESNPDGSFTISPAGDYKPSEPTTSLTGKESIDGMFQRSRDRASNP